MKSVRSCVPRNVTLKQTALCTATTSNCPGLLSQMSTLLQSNTIQYQNLWDQNKIICNMSKQNLEILWSVTYAIFLIVNLDLMNIY